MKRTEVYSKHYEGLSQEPYSHLKGFDERRDRISEYLGEECIILEGDKNNTGCGKFIWAEDKAVYIITSFCQQKETEFARHVIIQIMPSSAELPRGLSDLLVQEELRLTLSEK